MGRRFVIRVIDLGDNSAWSNLDRISVKDIKPKITAQTGHDFGSAIEFAYKEEVTDADAIEEILSDEFQSSIRTRTGSQYDQEQLRVVISHNPLSVGNGHVSQTNLVILANTEELGWRGTGNSEIPAQVGARKWDPLRVRNLLQDLLLDISIAHSPSVRPVLDKALADLGGHKELYRQKVQYVLSRNLTDSAFGPVDETAGYISFASLIRLLPEKERYREYVCIWDDFLTSQLGTKFFLSGNEAAENLRSRKKIWGQLPKPERLVSRMKDDVEASKERLTTAANVLEDAGSHAEANELKEHANSMSGPSLLLFTDRKANKEKQDQIVANPKLGSARHGGIKLIKAVEWDKNFKQFSEEGLILPLKVYLSSI